MATFTTAGFILEALEEHKSNIEERSEKCRHHAMDIEYFKGKIQAINEAIEIVKKWVDHE